MLFSHEFFARAIPRTPFLMSIAVAAIVAVTSTGMKPFAASEPAPAVTGSVLDNQVVAYYGTPNAPALGILGQFEPEEAAQKLEDHVANIDRLNGPRGATGAMDLIYGMAIAEPGPEGNHVGYLDDDIVEQYIDIAEEHDLQLILDLHIAQSDPLTEVKRVERFLKNPRVHVAIDGEYAVGPGGIPLDSLGQVTADQMNDVQEYVDELVRENDLPKKMVIMHQFMDETLVDGEKIREYDNVDFVLNMDAWGDTASKHERYEHFASKPWAHRMSYNIFMQLDDRVEPDRELVRLAPKADMFMYQ